MLIEGCNFRDCPAGGQLNFAKQLMNEYKDEIILVGVTTDKNIKIGEWTQLKIENQIIPFFPFRFRDSTRKSFLPERLKDAISLKKYKHKIILNRTNNVFIQSPEILIETRNWNFENICYSFPGIENPLEMPRYKWGKLLAKSFDKMLFKALKNVNTILARADLKSIDKLIERSSFTIDKKKVFQFPTRVNTEVFKPIEIIKLKRKLNLDNNYPVLICCGRINNVKGWEFILESFNELLKTMKDAKLIYVGDGEDRVKLEELIKENNLMNNVHITGAQNQKQVVEWMNIANLVVVGSYKEGWATIMIEAMACGKAIVSTDVSGASDMIQEGKNGYICKSRDSIDFQNLIQKALKLDGVENFSLNLSKKYSLSNLRNDLDRLWIRK
jgi:glycosyltransferase involved in cell wall biosynthesis